MRYLLSHVLIILEYILSLRKNHINTSTEDEVSLFIGLPYR